MALQQRTRRTRENTAVLLIDHQVGLFTGVRDLTVSDLKHNVVALAKAAKVLGLPIVPVTTARDSMWGPTVPELKAVVGNDILDRSSVNAWDDARFVKAVKAMACSTSSSRDCPSRSAHPFRRFLQKTLGMSPSSLWTRAEHFPMTSVRLESPGWARLA